MKWPWRTLIIKVVGLDKVNNNVQISVFTHNARGINLLEFKGVVLGRS